MATSLLQTKLYLPPLRPEWVSRPRLVERLNAGLHRKLTLVCAPAGFGKTTLVSEWIHSRDGMTAVPRPRGQASVPLRVAWLSLDEGDNDLTHFLTYVVAALQTVEDDIGKDVLSVLQSPRPPPLTSVLTSLTNELAVLPERIVLVLDDYHRLDSVKAAGDAPASQAIHDAIAFLLEHLPPAAGPPGGLHLVIATREDPLLPLARLRARGQLNELRGADLQFTISEAAEFLNQAMGLDLSERDIAALDAQIEGWIAGLQLAALALQGVSLQGRKDTASLVRSFSGSHRFVLDYLVEEVLEQQPKHVQTFLLQTSILDRLCGPLCDAVQCGGTKLQSSSEGTASRSGEARSGGQETLEYLERANLLVVPLDDQRQWYRYHHLFADVLQARLIKQQPNQVAALHRRASEWYEGQNSPSDAIRHALAAQDFPRAAGLVELAWPAWSRPVQSITWLGWMQALPDELVRARPVLCVAHAQALLSAGELEAAKARLLDAERWLEPTTSTSERLKAPSTKTFPEQPAPGLSRESRRMVVVDESQFRSLPASLAIARAYHAQVIGDVAGTVMYARRALDLLPAGDHVRRASLTTLLGLTYWVHGDLETAHRTISAGLAGMQRAGNLPGAMGGTFVLADIEVTLGHLYEAERTYEHALQLAAEHGEPMLLGTEDVYTGIGGLHRERGDLNAAAQDLLTGKKLGDQVELPDWKYRWCIAQARLKETLGDLDSALNLLDEAERLYVRTPLPKVRPIAALKARVWVRQGRLGEAQSWVRERGLSVDDDLAYLHEFEHVTLARVLIAQYKSGRADGSIQGAVRLLERLSEAAQQGKRAGSAIEILALQALAHEAQGSITLALASLERALTLAEPEGYLRLFVDEGPPMARLLSEALGQGIQPAYCAKLLSAFPLPNATPAAHSNIFKSKIPKSEIILEPLSERELEVLHFMAEGLTNPGIASRLFLSLNTIKVHARNIYGKLGVHNRTQAVVRARDLGILPST